MRSLISSMLLLCLVGCESTPVQRQYHACSFWDMHNVCHCWKGSKRVWVRDRDECTAYEACNGKKHPDCRLSVNIAAEIQRANERLAEELIKIGRAHV